MLKKAVILGVAGVLAAGFGVAGCSGSSDVVDGTETAKVEDVAETVGQVEESTAKEVETSYAETEATVQEKEGKYVYTILDGRVEVPLDTKVEDYIVPRKDLDIGDARPDALYFDILTLATSLGWVPTKFPELEYKEKKPYEYTYYRENGQEVYVRGMGNLLNNGQLAANNLNPSSGFCISVRDKTGYDAQSAGDAVELLFCLGNNGLDYVDKCQYGATFDGAVSYDYAVLFTYLLENADNFDFANAVPFVDLFEENDVLEEFLTASRVFALWK